MMKNNFVGKVVLVTGSTSGIGEATVKQFAEYGANCVVTGRNSEKIEKVIEACEKISPYKCKHLGVVGDITKDEDAKNLIDKIITKFGRLDILINNAGGTLLTSIEDPNSILNLDKLYALDVRSVVLLTILSVPHLIKTKGNIVNISSLCGKQPFKFFYGYCMAKASIDMFTKAIALELGEKGIRVNSVNSGGVRTNFFKAAGMNNVQINAQEDLIRDCSPLKLIGEPQDIAKLITYIASSDAQYMTGSNVLIDGGSGLTSTLKLIGT